MTGTMQPKRVLIVDDEPNVAITLAASLEKLGQEYIFETALNGDEALTKMQQNSYALLITDHNMPGMTGLDLAQAVRQISPGTQVILMTAYGTEMLHQTIEHLQIDGYIDKPFTMAQIREIVKHAIGRTNNAKIEAAFNCFERRVEAGLANQIGVKSGCVC